METYSPGLSLYLDILFNLESAALPHVAYGDVKLAMC